MLIPSDAVTKAPQDLKIPTMTEIELEALAARMFNLVLDKDDWEDIEDVTAWLRYLPEDRLRDLSDAYLKPS